MEGKKLALIISRAFQIIFAAVVLGTSVSLSKWLPHYQDECNALLKDEYCNFHHLIPSVMFAAAVGAFGMIDSIVGLVAIFFDMVPYIIGLGVDAIASLAYLAAGVAISVARSQDTGSGSRWTEIGADAAFNFLALIVTVALMGMAFFWQRSGGKMHSAV